MARLEKEETKIFFRYGGSVSQGFSRKCCYVRHNNHVFVSNANNWTNKPPKSSSTWIQRLSIRFHSSFSYALVVLWCYYTGFDKKIKSGASQKDKELQAPMRLTHKLLLYYHRRFLIGEFQSAIVYLILTC